MIDHAKLSALRMERQHLTDKANETEYKELYATYRLAIMFIGMASAIHPH